MGVLLVGLALAATVAVVTFRVRRILFRENLDGRVFLGGVESMLARDDRAQALKVCEAAQGTPVAEVKTFYNCFTHNFFLKM